MQGLQLQPENIDYMFAENDHSDRVSHFMSEIVLCIEQYLEFPQKPLCSLLYRFGTNVHNAKKPC